MQGGTRTGCWRSRLTHLDGEVLQLLSGREIDDVLVDAGAPLEQFLVQQEEDDARVRLGVDGDAKVVRVARGDADVACGKGGQTFSH